MRNPSYGRLRAVYRTERKLVLISGYKRAAGYHMLRVHATGLPTQRMHLGSER
jgi:hypothetical protein